MRPVQVRPAHPQDTEAMLPVIEAAYRGTGGRTGWTTESHLVRGARTSAADVLAMIDDPACTVLVAVGGTDDASDGPSDGGAEAGRVLGCCTVHPPEDGRELPEFGLFAVDPAAQSGGIGRALLDAAEKSLRAGGGTRLEIRVLQSRPELRAWYERRGFVPTGEVRPFPGSPDGLLVAGLGMDVLVKDLTTG